MNKFNYYLFKHQQEHLKEIMDRELILSISNCILYALRDFENLDFLKQQEIYSSYLKFTNTEEYRNNKYSTVILGQNQENFVNNIKDKLGCSYNNIITLSLWHYLNNN